jgi:alpha-L-fucosidase
MVSVHVLSGSCSTPQLSLFPCNSGVGYSFLWTFSDPSTSTGTFSLLNSSSCVTYDPTTTNLVVDSCSTSSSDLQTFTLRPDGTIFNPSTNLCWDSQYYGNVSGSVLGLYTCSAPQEWDLFSYSVTTNQITNVQNGNTLCVNGAPLPPPLPTPQQVAFIKAEVSLMISYDIVTQLTDVPNPQHFCIDAGGDSNFPVPPATDFNPSNLNTSQWIEAANAVGAGFSLLVASHCSGFLQWQSNVKLPDGSPYPYTVAQSSWNGGKGDIVDEYVKSSLAAGMPYGFYLTWNYNYLFNRGPRGFSNNPLQPGQINITESEYESTMLATIEEVWSRYPSSIFEIWFDGSEHDNRMNALIAKYQPQAISTDGTQAPNVARLVGRESGFAPYPVWSTDDSLAQDGSGDPNGRLFVPAEADTPVALKDAWFWKPNTGYRPLAELKAVYRNTVGANSNLELGVLPDNTGNIPSDQFAVLEALGTYIKTCHSLEAAINSTSGVGASIRLDLNEITTINRVILREDLSKGQIVQAFRVDVLPDGGYDPSPVFAAEGTAIGNKRILYFQSGPLPVKSIIVTATQLYPGQVAANWLSVAAYSPCEDE